MVTKSWNLYFALRHTTLHQDTSHLATFHHIRTTSTHFTASSDIITWPLSSNHSSPFLCTQSTVLEMIYIYTYKILYMCFRPLCGGLPRLLRCNSAVLLQRLLLAILIRSMCFTRALPTPLLPRRPWFCNASRLRQCTWRPLVTVASARWTLSHKLHFLRLSMFGFAPQLNGAIMSVLYSLRLFVPSSWGARPFCCWSGPRDTWQGFAEVLVICVAAAWSQPSCFLQSFETDRNVRLSAINPFGFLRLFCTEDWRHL